MRFAEIVIDLNPNLFTIGSFTLTWHGIFSVLGIIAGIRLGAYLASRAGISAEAMYDGAFYALIVGLIGARLHFVFENWYLFAHNLVRILYINEGGISQWGGVFGAAVGLLIWAVRSRVSYWKVLDAAGPTMVAGLFVGRIGDVINGEHHGTLTSLPWGVRYVNPRTLGQPDLVVHPEVAYEMILCLGLLALLLPFRDRLRRRLGDGMTGMVYFFTYSLGRFFLSFLRADRIEYGLRQAQWASVMVMILAAGAAVYLISRRSLSGHNEPGEVIEPTETTPAADPIPTSEPLVGA